MDVTVLKEILPDAIEYTVFIFTTVYLSIKLHWTFHRFLEAFKLTLLTEHKLSNKLFKDNLVESIAFLLVSLLILAMLFGIICFDFMLSY